MKTTAKPLRIAFVVPHIFMHRDILPNVIFSPGQLAVALCNELSEVADVTLFSPGPVTTRAKNITADLNLFERELEQRGDTYTDLLKKHPATFMTLARQVQSEIIAKAYSLANQDRFDIVHIYTNEEELGLVYAKLCTKPVVFTHHDPFNLLIKYKSIFPKYKDHNWISMSYAQRTAMPKDTNWIGNVYHGLAEDRFLPTSNPSGDYVAYFGRIIKPKGVHLAIEAIKEMNKDSNVKMKLKIAGKHYASSSKDTYWKTEIEPQLDDTIEYVGYIKDQDAKNEFLANAAAVLVPSEFNEPFGMVAIESLASGTPVVALDNGALPEIINQGVSGYIVTDDEHNIENLAEATNKAITDIDRATCRREFESKFLIERMAKDHYDIYQRLATE